MQLPYKIACFLALALLLLPPASAQVDSNHPPDPNGRPSEWDLTFGGGAMIRPTYEGSNRSKVSPVPFIKVIWKDTVSLDEKGLSAYWRRDGFLLGGGLTYGGGRKDSKSNGIFNQGDDRLKGLGNINNALELSAFSSYDFGSMQIKGSVTKFTGSDNNGVRAEIGLFVPYKLAKRMMLTPHVGATWANQNYMQTFFGVTPTQAANSSFPEFHAASGFNNVTVGINYGYLYDRHWVFGAEAGLKQLSGDAANSPMTFSKTSGIFLMVLGYHF